MNGIINILKPTGVSSNKILNIIKQKYKGEKVGHFGTLDPLACGVLPVAIGKATKLFDYFLNKDKEYIAVFKFGLTTDTLDSEGNIITEESVDISKEKILDILPQFHGIIDQTPPMFSAININGSRAYDLARRGHIVDIPSKKIKIYSIELINEIANNTFIFKINCSSGTYIRSLVRDMAKAFNTVGYMPQLIRVKAGPFSIQDANSIEEIQNNNFKVIKIEDVVSLKKISITEDYYLKLSNGVKIKADFDENDDFLLYCKNELFGIACIENNIIKIKTNLRGA